MQATRTSLRGVGRIDEGGFNASGQGLVRREGLQLRKRPAVQMSEHPAPGPISDARQILKDDSLPVCFRLGHNLLRHAVVRVPDKSMLPSRDTPQHTPGCATAVGLETRSCLLELSFLMAHKLRRVESIVGANGDSLDTQVNAQTAGWFRDFRRFSTDRDVQVKLTVPEYQIGAASLPGAQLEAPRGGQLQLTRHPTLGADGQTRLVEVTLESQRARIEPQRSSLLKLVLLLGLAGKGFRDFGNRVDHMLRWQAGLPAHPVVGGVVDIVTAMQFPFARHLRDRVAGFGELADGRFQFTAEVRRNL